MKKKLNRRFSGILIFIILLSFAFMGCRTAGSKEANKKPSGTLSIVFMNDTHSHLFPWRDPGNNREYGGAARWATIIKDIREEAGEILFLHAGDMFVGNVGTYLTASSLPDWERLPSHGYRGLLDILVFDKLGLDAISVGNHEFDYGFYWAHRLFSKASFNALVANATINPIIDSSSFDHSPFIPFQIYERGGFRIGVIGVMTGTAMFSSMVRPSSASDAVNQYIETLQRECDLIVVLSHLGVEADVQLASNVLGLDVIVGGHTHTLLREPRIVSDTIITQARAFGEFIGRLDLEYQEGSLVNFRHRLIPVNFSVPEDPEMKAWLEPFLHPLNLEHALQPQGEGNNSLGAFIANLVNENFPCDVVLIKTGIIQRELAAGRVSAEDLFNTLAPHIVRGVNAEKDSSPQQIMDILTGRVPNRSTIERTVNRTMLSRAMGLRTLIGTELPVPALEVIETLCRDRAGSTDALFMQRFESGVQGNTRRVIMDLPSLIDLFQEEILDGSFEYHNLEMEIIDLFIPL